MVGVLNGKKGKACSVVVVAFLLCGVFGGLVVEQSLGSFVGGWDSVGNSYAWGGEDIISTRVNLTCGADYYIEVNSVWIYTTNTTAAQTVQGAVYSNVSHRVALGGVVDVNGAGWYESVIDPPATLLAGEYYIVGGYSATAAFYAGAKVDDGSVANITYITATKTLAMDLSFVTWEAHKLSMYVDYNVRSYEGGNVVYQSDVASSAWLGVGISLGLVAISLLLALKSRSWAVNFLFGLSLVGFLGWQFANASVELFGGWLDFMVLVGAVLVLVKGAVLVRASGV